jgi:Mitochondrial carrier protein
MLLHVIRVIRTICQENGWRGFYNGYFITLFSFVPFSVAFYTFFELLKKRRKLDALHFPYLLKCAMIASFLASSMTSPLDLIKTRWQLAPKPSLHFLELIRAFSRFSVHTLSTYGAKGLLMNALARSMWMTPAVSLSIATYEYLKPK